jgi:hypothetical protein
MMNEQIQGGMIAFAGIIDTIIERRNVRLELEPLRNMLPAKRTRGDIERLRNVSIGVSQIASYGPIGCKLCFQANTE